MKYWLFYLWDPYVMVYEIIPTVRWVVYFFKVFSLLKLYGPNQQVARTKSAGLRMVKAFETQPSGNFEFLLRCASKPGGSSLAPYYEGILDTPSSLAPFQPPASLGSSVPLAEMNF